MSSNEESYPTYIHAPEEGRGVLVAASWLRDVSAQANSKEKDLLSSRTQESRLMSCR